MDQKTAVDYVTSIARDPLLKWAMVKMAFNLSPEDLNKLEKEFGPIWEPVRGVIDVSIASIKNVVDVSKFFAEGLNTFVGGEEQFNAALGKIDVRTIPPPSMSRERYFDGLSPLEAAAKELDQDLASSWNPCEGESDFSKFGLTGKETVDFTLQPKVDDTKEFNLVRCPKCELMVEELVATPYRHVCASCAKEV